MAVDDVLVFGPEDGDRLEIGPFRERPGDRRGDVLQVLEAPAVLWRDGSKLATRRSANGFEVRAIGSLGVDLQRFREAGGGSLRFGDHDSTLVQIDGYPGGDALVEVTVPEAGVWGEPVGWIGLDAVDRLLAAVAAIERVHGELTGELGCCASNEPTFRPPDEG